MSAFSGEVQSDLDNLPKPTAVTGVDGINGANGFNGKDGKDFGEPLDYLLIFGGAAGAGVATSVITHWVWPEENIPKEEIEEEHHDDSQVSE